MVYKLLVVMFVYVSIKVGVLVVLWFNFDVFLTRCKDVEKDKETQVG